MRWCTARPTQDTQDGNAHCERLNPTIAVCFVDYHDNLLFTDPALFKQKMSDWLVFYKANSSTKCNTG